MTRESEIADLANEVHRYYGVGGTVRRLLRDARKKWEADAVRKGHVPAHLVAERDALAAECESNRRDLERIRVALAAHEATLMALRYRLEFLAEKGDE